MKKPELYETALSEAEDHLADIVARVLGKARGSDVFTGLLPEKENIILVEMENLQLEEATFVQNLRTFAFSATASFRYSVRKNVQAGMMLLVKGIATLPKEELDETNLVVVRIAKNGVSNVSVDEYSFCGKPRLFFSGTVSFDVVFDAGQAPKDA